jgi:hypothetical protein
MHMRTLGLVAAVSSLPLAVPLAAQAVMLQGQVEIAGGLVDLQTANFAAGGNLDYVDNMVDVSFATGDFASLIGTNATFNDLSFTPGEVIYFGESGLMFTAGAFGDFDNTAPDWAFMASGILQLDGFDPTPGVFAFSTQATSGGQAVATFSSSTTAVPATPIPVPASVVMLFGALGGLAFIARRRNA